MYKNFSYIFGLGALLMLIACDSGDKKATDENQKAATRPQKLIDIQKGERKPIKEISSKEQIESGTKEDDIYADINKPIESEIPSSEIKSDVEAGNTGNIEEVKTEEGAVVPSQKEEPVANTESANETTADSTSESNAEKEIQKKGTKVEETQSADTVNNEPKVEEVQSTEASNNAEAVPAIAEEVPAVATSEENTENPSETPEVSPKSDIPVILEESVEDKSSAEVSLDSEPTPVMDESPVQEVVSESEPTSVVNEDPVQEVVSQTENQ